MDVSASCCVVATLSDVGQIHLLCVHGVLLLSPGAGVDSQVSGLQARQPRRSQKSDDCDHRWRVS